MRPYDATRTALFSPERGDTVLQPGFRVTSPDSLRQLCVEAARLAYVRTEDSATESQRLASALSQAHFGAVTSFNHPETDGQGFGAVCAEWVLLAFRGTQPDRVGDLVTDAKTLLGPWALGPGNVHRGFGNMASGLWEQVDPWLRSLDPRPANVVICGHSLGAAIATLLAVPAQATHLITIGSPRVGDQAFATDVLSKIPTIERIVDCCDIVAQIPPRLPPLLAFEHVGDPVYIDRAGGVQAQVSAGSMLSDQIQARASYLVEHAFRAGTVMTRDLADHAPANYIRAFWP